MSSSGVFGGGGFTYGNVEFKGENLTVYGSNTYHDFSLASGVTQDVTFEYGTTQTMTMAYLSGSAGHIHTIHTNALIPATFVKSGGGTISSASIYISYIEASPADMWCYGTNSVEGDGCSGWVSCDMNSAPTIETIALWTTDDTPSEITSMNPQVEYNIKVPVTDNDTLNDLSTVKTTLYYDSEGNYSEGEVPTSGNTQTCAILTWTKSTNTLTIESGSGSSWAVNNSSSVFPSLSETSSTFEFHFKPGKVATYTQNPAKWHTYVKATDSVSNTGTGTKQNLTMNWYGEIAVNTASVNWGFIAPGTDFGDGTKQTGISVTYIVNGPYAEQVDGASPWTGAPSGSATMNSSGSPSAGQFSLKADDTATIGSAVLVNVSPSYTTIDNTGTITGESGDNVTTNTLWLKLGTPFTAATYSGTIYWQIAQP